MVNRLKLSDLTKRNGLVAKRGRTDAFVQPVRTRAKKVSALDFRPLIKATADAQETDNALEELKAAENAQVLSQDKEGLGKLDIEIREAISDVTDPEERDRITTRIWFKHIEEGGLPTASHPRTLKHVRQLSAQRLSDQYSLEVQALITKELSAASLDAGTIPSVEDLAGRLEELRASYASSPLITGSLVAEQTFQQSSDKVILEATALATGRLQDAKDFIAEAEVNHAILVGDDRTKTPGFADLADRDYNDPEILAADIAAFSEANTLYPGYVFKLAENAENWVNARAAGGDEDDLAAIKSFLDNFEDIRIDGMVLSENNRKSRRHPKSAMDHIDAAYNSMQRLEQKLEDDGSEVLKGSGEAASVAGYLMAEELASNSQLYIGDPAKLSALVEKTLNDPTVRAMLDNLPEDARRVTRGMIVKDLAGDTLKNYGIAEVSRSQVLSDQITAAGLTSYSAAAAMLAANRDNMTGSDIQEANRSLQVNKRVEGWFSGEGFKRTIGAVLATGSEAASRLSPTLQGRNAVLQGSLIQTLKSEALRIVSESPVLSEEDFDATLQALAESPEAKAVMQPYLDAVTSAQADVTAWSAVSYTRLTPAELAAHIATGTEMFKATDTALGAQIRYQESQIYQRDLGAVLGADKVMSRATAELTVLSGVMETTGDGEKNADEINLLQLDLLTSLEDKRQELTAESVAMSPGDANAFISKGTAAAYEDLIKDSEFHAFRTKKAEDAQEATTLSRTRKDELASLLAGDALRSEMGLGDFQVMDEIREWEESGGSGFFTTHESAFEIIRDTVDNGIFLGIDSDKWGQAGATYQGQTWLNIDDVISGEVKMRAMSEGNFMHEGFGGAANTLITGLASKHFEKLPTSITGFTGSNPIARAKAVAILNKKLFKEQTDQGLDWKHGGQPTGLTKQILDTLGLQMVSEFDPFHKKGNRRSKDGPFFTTTPVGLPTSIREDGTYPPTPKPTSALSRFGNPADASRWGVEFKGTFDATEINAYTTLMVVSQEQLGSISDAKAREVIQSTSPDLEITEDDVKTWFDAQEFLLKKHQER